MVAGVTQWVGVLDAEDFVVDGYPAVRGAFDAATNFLVDGDVHHRGPNILSFLKQDGTGASPP